MACPTQHTLLYGMFLQASILAGKHQAGFGPHAQELPDVQGMPGCTFAPRSCGVLYSQQLAKEEAAATGVSRVILWQCTMTRPDVPALCVLMSR
jgi:hypothetical protein